MSHYYQVRVKDEKEKEKAKAAAKAEGVTLSEYTRRALHARMDGDVPAENIVSALRKLLADFVA